MTTEGGVSEGRYTGLRSMRLLLMEDGGGGVIDEWWCCCIAESDGICENDIERSPIKLERKR